MVADTKPETSRIIAAKRPKAGLNLRLRERDVSIVEAVHRLRVLSTEQIAQLFFPTRHARVSTACRDRLRRIVGAGLLERAEQEQRRSEGRRPYLYMLADAGAQLLIDELGVEQENVDWNPSYNNVRWPFLRHQLAINDVYVAMALSAPQINWSLDGWVDDRILRAMHTDRVRIPGHSQPVAIIPDAYFRLAGPGGKPEMHFFLEIDRATMTVASKSHLAKSWQDKIRAYQEYFRQGMVTQRYGTDKVRVLTTTIGTGRLGNMKAATEELGGRGRYWFAEHSMVTANNVLRSPIWQRAGTTGTLELVSVP